jgi:dTDP-4-dehydrorhamnose reductase
MINILVTGSNGQLGSEIRNCQADYPDYRFTFVDVEDADLTVPEDIKKLFDKEQYHFCINCAAYTAVDQAEKETEKAHAVNAKAVENIARICGDKDIFLIHISTDYVFDGTNHTPYTEQDKTAPASAYGASKLEGEQTVLQHARKWMIIRTSWLYSAYGHNFVKTIKRLTAERDELKVVDDQVGTPTFAGDLARALLMSIAKLHRDQGDFGEVFNYSNEGVASWYDFAKAIAEESANDCKVLPIPTKDFPTLANRPAYSILSKVKIKETFGLEIPHWRDSLRGVIKQLSD